MSQPFETELQALGFQLGTEAWVAARRTFESIYQRGQRDAVEGLDTARQVLQAMAEAQGHMANELARLCLAAVPTYSARPSGLLIDLYARLDVVTGLAEKLPQLRRSQRTFRKAAEREAISAWFCWDSEVADEGPHLLILDGAADENDAKVAARELLIETWEMEPEEGLASIGAALAWRFDGSRIADQAGVRGPSDVEFDLLEELTALRQEQPDY